MDNGTQIARTVWFEMTKSANSHGGPGWELGTCLWCPGRKPSCGDRYNIMRDVRVGDFVIHCYDSQLRGCSRVAVACRETCSSPPTPARGAQMAPYFRVDLCDYQPFGTPMPLKVFMAAFGEEVRKEIETAHPSRYPFCISMNRVTSVQGRFLTRVTPKLIALFAIAFDNEPSMARITKEP